MTASNSSMSVESRGYGRGLILGFTMAETFLLLVFSLLLVAAAAISVQQKELNQAIETQQAISSQLEKLRNKKESLERENKSLFDAKSSLEQTIASLPPGVRDNISVDDNWQELTLVRKGLKRLSDAGVSAVEANKLFPALKVLKDNNFLATDELEITERLQKVFVAANEATTLRPHTWPPIINLSEAGGYYFAVGSAQLSVAFKQTLSTDIAGQIANYLNQYDVDVVEVIGHTDEQPLRGLSSNLDKIVSDVLEEISAVADIKPADNAGLGLARAIAVVQVLRHDPRLKNATILPLSAAQLIVPGDTLSTGQQKGDVKTRRRIEIRIRKRSESAKTPE